MLLGKCRNVSPGRGRGVRMFVSRMQNYVSIVANGRCFWWVGGLVCYLRVNADRRHVAVCHCYAVVIGVVNMIACGPQFLLFLKWDALRFYKLGVSFP